MQESNLKLSHLYDLCRRAHNWISFNPEKIAKQYVESYSEMLENDLKELGENTGNYEAKFIEKFSSWMSSKSNCASSAITGGSGFNVRRAEKANRAEQNKSDAFYLWRAKYFQAVNRVPTKSPEEELQIAERRLEDLTNYQTEAKEINVKIRKLQSSNKKANIVTTQEDVVKFLLSEEHNPEVIKRIDEWRGTFSIPSYHLTNNDAKIKSTALKVKVMLVRIERKDTWNDIVFEGGHVTIEDDRFKIFHDERPEKEIMQELKSNGFKWSPNWKCWCRKHTGNALFAIQRLSFIQIK